LKEVSEKDPALAKASGDYKFILEDALDAVSGGLETTLEAISIQELAHKNKKK
jgi:hypothetical protein